MTQRKLLAVGCGLLAVVFLIVAGIYFTKTASEIPSFFPGYLAQSKKGHHYKHGIAFVGLAVLSLVGAWMLSGSQKTSPD